MNIVDTAAVALSVKRITGNTADAAAAAGYSAWVSNVTGSAPTVVQQGNIARVVLSKAQALTMQKEIEKSLFAGKPGQLRIELGSVINPLLFKYVIPAAAVCFIAGYLVKSKL